MRKLFPALALLAALIIPSQAQAAEIGLNVAGGAAAGDAEVAAVADRGAKWARHFLFFDDIDRKGMEQFRDRVVIPERRRGVKTLIVVAGKTQQAPNADAFARVMGEMAEVFAGGPMAYEVWNEADEPLWWKPAPNPAAYVDLLKKSYRAIKDKDATATVLATPTTGANYTWVEELYKNGAKGNFDAMAVHTDTACLLDSPYSYYRENGRIARFTFLGVREVKATMQANGDDKPVWITELGWAVRPNDTCDSGAFAGKKKAGVTEEQQAQFMLEAFHCLQTDPLFGVTVAMWFTHSDPHYGLQQHKPADDAFRSMRGDTANDRLSGPCGDFQAPEVQILEPKPGTLIGDRDSLRVKATSTDKSVLRMTFQVHSRAQEIRNFTNDGNPLDFAKNIPFIDWQGVRQLPFGKHRVVVTALDPSGNEGRAEVEFTRVNPRTLKPVAVKFSTLKISGKGRTRTVKSRLSSVLPFVITGKVAAEWQNKRKGKWKKIHGGAKNAQKNGRNLTLSFKQKLKYKGAWRVRLKYGGNAPFRKGNSPWKRFTVR